ncbi:hypothetical protein Cgig2_007698 [Carnegiea gigantea]|uniref:Uncharacterized protein n=1 Tax=Carnegiea gigantea TaxID=171969 RepID=A0A9Q1JI65_9CARY|nr:hypothetical protein Cgig2_007698 [Carnegiea gigantea]
MGVHTTQLRNKPKPKKSKPKEFNNRMSPKGLRQLIEKLNDKQKEVVKEIGFGGFLYLQVDMILGKLAVWLVRNFDTCSCSLPLTHGRLRVTKHDVYMTLALTKGPLEVTEAKSALEDRLDETEMLDEAQAVHEEEPSNATPEPAVEAEHDTIRSKIKALLEDAKKASNEIITNTRVLVGVTTKFEKLVPEAHASLKGVRTIAVQTTTDGLFAETTLPEKPKSTKPVLSADPYESEVLLAVEAIEKQFLTAQKSKHHFPQFTPPSFSLGLSQEENKPIATQFFICEAEHQEESVAPTTGVVFRELDVDVPLQDVQEASYVGKGKAIMEEVSRRPRIRSMECSTTQVPTVESNHAMKPEYGGQRTPCTFLSCYSGAWIFVARVIVVDYYSSFSNKECLRDRQVLALR